MTARLNIFERVLLEDVFEPRGPMPDPPVRRPEPKKPWSPPEHQCAALTKAQVRCRRASTHVYTSATSTLRYVVIAFCPTHAKRASAIVYAYNYDGPNTWAELADMGVR
jgi:hypothetical protein